MPDPRKKRQRTLISLFAGCGGSSAGYKMAGYKCLLAAEWWDKAAAAYRESFPDTPVWEGDVTELDIGEVLKLTGLARGDLDLLDGSPPCQGFSTSGRRDLEDPRNQLFREFIRLLGGLMPKCFVMENVAGFATGKMRPLFREAMSSLQSQGYRVRAALLNASWYGVPQDRERTIVIGVREDLGKEPMHPSPSHRLYPISVEEALGSPLAMRNPEFNNRWRPPILPSPTLVKSSPPECRLCLGSDRDSIIFSKSHPARNLTLAEARVLQSFPDWLRSPSYGMVGNSVPPLLSKAIGECISRILDGE